MTRKVGSGSWIAVGLGLLLLTGGGCASSDNGCTGGMFPRLHRLFSTSGGTTCSAEPCQSCCSCCPCCGCCCCSTQACGGDCGCRAEQPRAPSADAAGKLKIEAAPTLKQPSAGTVTPPEKPETQTAPTRRPSTDEVVPLPPKASPGRVRDEGTPWPGELPAPPKKPEKPSPGNGPFREEDSSSQYEDSSSRYEEGSSQDEDDARAAKAKSLDRVHQAMKDASSVSQRQSPRPPQLMAAAAGNPPRLLSPADSQLDPGPAAVVRLVAHEDPLGDIPDQPRCNPLR